MDSRTDFLPYYAEASFNPLWLNPDAKVLDTIHKIPSFSFTNQEGDLVSDKSFDGKIYVTDFFFTTCPGICPTMTANLKILQDTFIEDNDVLLLSHSVTPESDSVPILNRYAKRKGVISGKWHLVTGNRDEIYTLGRSSYFVEEDLGLKKSNDEFLHTENFVLIDKNKHIRGIYNGLNKTSVQQLIADIKTLKKEG
jgi:protein SCO1/2